MRGIDADRPDPDPGRALFELAPRLTRLENAVLRAVEPPLTFRQFRLMERIAGGQTTVTQLGRSATIALPAISESVDGLVSKGLLIRRANERDRRESQLSLTDSGRAALHQADALLSEAADQVFRAVPRGRRANMARDIRAVTEAVTQALIDARNERA